LSKGDMMETLSNAQSVEVTAYNEARIRQQEARRICGLPLEIDICEVPTDLRQELLVTMRNLRDGIAEARTREV
jgi:hypothetical protein